MSASILHAGILTEAAGEDRLAAAVQSVAAWPGLVGDSLLELELGCSPHGSRKFIALASFDASKFGNEERVRFAFWAARSNAHVLLPNGSAFDRLRFYGAMRGCESRIKTGPSQPLASALLTMAQTMNIPTPEWRAKPRYRAELEVQLGGLGLYSTHDISEGGVFIPSAVPLPLEDRIKLLFFPPNAAEPMEVEARVAHVRLASQATTDRPAGIGLEFVSPSMHLLSAINEMMKAPEKSRRRGGAGAAEGLAGVPSEPPPTLQCDQGMQSAQDYLRDLSKGAAFVLSNDVLPFRTQVLLKGVLPDDTTFFAEAEVVHVQQQGMGLHFRLDAALKARLEDLRSALEPRSSLS